jgi:TolB-like protein
MRCRLRCVLGLACLWSLLAAGPTAAAAPMTVVVLYFDNNTGDPAQDVLQKGLADMMVTDLAAVEGLAVVEREKLQQLIAELKLQKSRFFDPATAQRLGRGIGATHAVTGAIAALSPQIRLDVRLIEVATGRVVMSDKVVGSADRFFDLEAELASRFAAALKLRLAPRPEGGGAQDLDTVLAYSKGLDAADRGDLDAASRQLAGVVSRAPGFRLAQERYATLLKRVYEARARRDQVLESGEALLLARAREAVGSAEALKADDRQGLRHLGYRTFLCQYHLLLLGRHLGLRAQDLDTFSVFQIAAEKRGRALELMRAYFEEVRRLAGELETFEEAHPKMLPGSPSFALDPEDGERARAIGINGAGSWSFAASWRLGRAAAQFAFLGKPDFWSPVKFTTSPTLAELDPKLVGPALGLLDAALARIAKARFPGEAMRQRDAIDTLDLYAQALLRLGRRPEAVARWQTILDRYPTCEKYAEFERNIQDALGVTPSDPQYVAALAECNPMALLAPWTTQAIERARKAGPGAFGELMAEVDERCGKDPRFVPSGEVFYYSAGTTAVATGACDFGRRMLARLGRSQQGQALRPQLEKTLAEKCR